MMITRKIYSCLFLLVLIFAFGSCLSTGLWGGHEILGKSLVNIIDSPYDQNIVWTVKKVYRGKYRLQIRFIPRKDNEYYLLRHEPMPFKCEIEIHQGEIVVKRNICFDIKAGTLGVGIYLYDVPKDFTYKYNDELQVIIKNISFPDELSGLYSQISLWLERDSFLP